MRDFESFDAFYARTVRQVTGRVREITGDAAAADEAVREAYARAFQQWYEVSGYRDPEGWVLDAAEDVYRWRHDHPTPPQTPAGADLHDGLAASAATSSLAAGSTFADLAGEHAAGSTFSGPAGEHSRTTAQHAWAEQPRSRPPAGLWRRTPTRGGIVGALAAIVLIAGAGVGYVALSGHQTPSRAGAAPGAKHSKAKPKPHMLPAGRTGSRASVPWSLVRSGWTLAELSTAQPDADGSAAGSGDMSLYLVDPEGGRYLIRGWSADGTPTLLAWSGDATKAVLSTDTGAGRPQYSLLTLATGRVSSLPLPTDVTVVGFTRPDGFNLLAVRQGAGKLKLQRYSLAGALQATLATMPQTAAEPQWQGTCGTDCGALSSPNGVTDIWGTSWNEMQLVSNAGGLIRRLHVQDSGKPPACVPVSWWNSSTVLANCPAPNQPAAISDRLWLVPTDGASPTPLTQGSGTVAGIGFDLGAWRMGGQVYVTQTTATQCPSAASGPGGLGIQRLGSGGSPSAVAIPGTTNTRNAVLAAIGSRLLVLAQASCPGSYSLLWFDPATGVSQTLVAAPSGELGVIAAIPFGTL